MDPMIPTFLSIALYLLTAAGFAWRLAVGPENVPWRAALLATGGVGVVIHTAVLWGQMDTATGLNLGFFNAASLVAALMALIVILGALQRPVENLMVFILPVAAVIELINQFLGTGVAPITRFPGGLEIHVITSIVAFAVLGIAVVQALLLAWQDRRLRHRHPGGLVRALPPLQEMEHLLFQMIRLGFVLLTLALITGTFYLEDLFAQHLAHKTVFSVVAWAIFALLLCGRWRYGWRGRTAIRWTLGGFAALLLAYFGTKLVLELILGRG